MKKACVWFEGMLFRSERGTKRGHTPPQSPNNDLQQGSGYKSQRTRIPERQQHVACDSATGELMYLGK